MTRKLIAVALATMLFVVEAQAAPSIGLYTITLKTAFAIYDNHTAQTRRVLITVCANSGDVTVGTMFVNSVALGTQSYKLTTKQCISSTYDVPAGQAIGVQTGAPLANGTYSVDPIG